MRNNTQINSFDRDETGTIAVIFALTLTAITAFVGLAVDGSRWYSARYQHANTIDVALLAGARYIQTHPGDVAGAVATATTLYQRNLDVKTPISSNTITFTSPDDGGTFTFTGAARISSTFLNVVGIRSMQISSPAVAMTKQSGRNSGSNLEIALMLDVTGSMCDDGVGPCSTGIKISALKQAASDLTDIVLGQQSQTYTSRIALVPFSSAVRIDADGTSNSLMQQLTNMPQTWSGWGPAYSNCNGGGYVGEIWVGGSCSTATPQLQSNMKLMPCVTERAFGAGIGFDPSDSAPRAGNWLDAQGGDRAPLSWDSSDTPLTQYTGASAADMSYNWNYSSDGSGCMSQPGNEILPLSADLQTVKRRLGTLTAFGPTAGALGAVWAQYLLSPNWCGIWTGNQRPGSYSDTQTLQSSGAPVLRKVAVLMTDGGFNTSRQFAEDSLGQLQTVSNNALSVCANMKANGVEIYTIGFNLDALSAPEAAIATTTLQTCGTDISHFYNSLSVDSLDAAFKDIALKLSPIRLSQ